MNGWDAALYLESGHVFLGQGFGARKTNGGEIVFNTGMTGYQEIFTDPSYRRQIVVMGYPHLGNTGVNSEDTESNSIYLSAVVCRNYCATPSSWRSEKPLHDYLVEAVVPAISDVDTRRITQIIRDEGAQRAVLFPNESVSETAAIEEGKKLLKNVEPMEGLELVSQVSCRSPYEYWEKGEHESRSKAQGTIVVYDYGVKSNILRQMRRRNFRVKVVPYNTPHQEVMAEKPLAVILSNGPGDPATVAGAVEEIQALVGKVPIMGICMGHQLLARALGGSTYKLKFGHHGINHPVKDLQTQRISITSQNHGFSVNADDLRMREISVSHINLNDNTLEGFVSKRMKLMSVQFHPEACPGPSDANDLFGQFLKGFLS